MLSKDLIVCESFYPSRSVEFDLFYGNCAHNQSNPPGFVFGPVISNLYIFQYTASGCGDIVIDGRRFHIQAGDFSVFFPGQVRVEYTSESDPFTDTWLELNGKIVERFLSSLGITRENPIIHNCAQSRIPILMQEILVTAGSTPNPQRVFLLGARILELFDEFSRIRARENQHSPVNAQVNYAQQAAYYMDMHFHDKTLTVESLAKAIGLNRSYLYKIFKKEFDVSPQTYLAHHRISKACEFLVLPQATITSVAYSVGYDPPIFSQAFKRLIGISPSEYREKNLNK